MQVIARGNSMLPTLTEGSVYTAEPVNSFELDVGDIIVYYIDEMIVCHRITKIIRSKSGRLFFRTKGDNNCSADPYTVLPQYILGRLSL